MKFTSMMEVSTDVDFLVCSVYPRYWEDAAVNGIKEDNDDPKMPFVDIEKGAWSFWVKLDTGKILDWPKGTTASVHYKVCDAGCYYLFSNQSIVVSKEYEYVPEMLCPKDNGYGDYIIMDIEEDGTITDFVADLSYFKGE